ncbi:unnamed protein product [Cyprideis torosa]|uniref:Uncharacterized protein n=1 Tax=Cyprideis torosa TaxID=163714 RepID=A0A7R8WCY5_9CRUS|nr:unnamed protein product [Cyprideis torosa]CAG0894047.1 unnamed protein product [Cyprideis torosa]
MMFCRFCALGLRRPMVVPWRYSSSLTSKLGNSENQNLVLKVINDVSISDLQEEYKISASKAEAIDEYRKNQGRFDSVEDLLKCDGFGLSIADKLCRKIIQANPSRNPNRHDEKLSGSEVELEEEDRLSSPKETRGKKPLLDGVVRPKLKLQEAARISSIVSIFLSPSDVSWCQLAVSPSSPTIFGAPKKPVSIVSWATMEIDLPDKKVDLNVVSNYALEIVRFLPMVDAYVFEDPIGGRSITLPRKFSVTAAVRGASNPAMIPALAPCIQIYALASSLHSLIRAVHSHEQEGVSEEEHAHLSSFPPLSSSETGNEGKTKAEVEETEAFHALSLTSGESRQPQIVLIGENAVGKHFNLYVGGERVSAQRMVSTEFHSGKYHYDTQRSFFPSLNVSDRRLLSEFNKFKATEREGISNALIVGLAFADLVLLPAKAKLGSSSKNGSFVRDDKSLIIGTCNK